MTTPTVNTEPTVEAKRPHCICGTWLHAHENDTGKCLWPDCGCSRFQFAEDAHEPTVEEALKELREMFPATRWIEVICSQYARDSLGPVEYAVKFEAPPNQGKRFVEATLSEAMAAVRKWKESQS